MPYVLALDQGTTSSRALLFDARGAVVGSAQQEFAQHFPQPGWVEHDPEDLWRTQLATAREAIEASGVAPGDIAALGITNQRETTVVWDRATGEPVHNAIVWQDRRTADACAALREAGHEDAVRQRTGLVLDPYFSGTKLAWILDHVPGARGRAARGELAFGTVDAWLLWKLTGGRVHATDVTNASRTLLFDIHALDWSAAHLDLLGVPPEVLPEVRSSSGAFGTADAEWLGAEIPITGMAGDQHAALFGQRCTSPGMAKNTYGTGCFLLYHTGVEPVESTHGLLTTLAWQLDGQPAEYALEGAVFVAGAAVQWLRDELGIIETTADVEPLAASVESADGVVVVPAFTGLGAPTWDPHARGTVLGITRGTSAAHIARATLDGVAHQVADVLEAMTADAGSPLAELRVDGGMTDNGLLMQIQADLLGVPVVRAARAESTAFGAALLAGLGAGVWSAADMDIASSAQWEPSPEANTAPARRLWRRAVERATAWAQE